MKQNGTLTAHSREWPLYERWGNEEYMEAGKKVLRTVLMLSLSPKDRAEKEQLDEIELKRLGGQ